MYNVYIMQVGNYGKQSIQQHWTHMTYSILKYWRGALPPPEVPSAESTPCSTPCGTSSRSASPADFDAASRSTATGARLPDGLTSNHGRYCARGFCFRPVFCLCIGFEKYASTYLSGTLGKISLHFFFAFLKYGLNVRLTFVQTGIQGSKQGCTNGS